MHTSRDEVRHDTSRVALSPLHQVLRKRHLKDNRPLFRSESPLFLSLPERTA
ncbi:hypothetical protein [Aeromonas veronii]